MIDWLRFLLMIFYAPVRGMRGMRDRGSLAPVVLIAFARPVRIWLCDEKVCRSDKLRTGSAELFHTAKIIAIVAIVLVPILTLVANMFERRGSFRVVLTQEYAPLAASTVLRSYCCQSVRHTNRTRSALLRDPGSDRRDASAGISNSGMRLSMLRSGPLAEAA